MSWQPINTAPTDKLVIVGWRNEEGEERHEFDFIEDGCWSWHHNFYEHACIVGKPEGVPCTMPSEQAPYQYWMELPELPK